MIAIVPLCTNMTVNANTDVGAEISQHSLFMGIDDHPGDLEYDNIYFLRLLLK